MRSAHHPLTPLVFIAPAVIVLGVFVVTGFMQTIGYSLTRYTAFREPVYIGLDNYVRLFSSDRFWLCLLNSAIYLLVTPALIVLSLTAAITVEANLRGMKWLRLALFLPVITPTLVGSVAWRILLKDDGVINTILGVVGIDAVRWLTDYPFTLVSAMFVTLWKGFGFYMMIFLAALLAVPGELKEAASIDGASRFQVFRNVTLPAIRPAIVLVAIVSSISALKVFEEIFVTVRGGPITQQTVVPLIYRVAFEEGEYGLASAIGFVLFLVILVFSLVNLFLARRAGS